MLLLVNIGNVGVDIGLVAAVIGNLRAARFGRDGAWRTMALFGALDELRHTQIPLYIFHNFIICINYTHCKNFI